MKDKYSEPLDSPIVKTEEIKEGIEKEIYLKTKDENEYVIKIHETDVYQSNPGFLAGPKLLENYVQPNTTIPVPTVLYTSEISEEKPFYIMEYISGFHLDVSQSTYTFQEHVIRESAKYLAKLRELPHPTRLP